MNSQNELLTLIAEMQQYLEKWDFDLNENIDLEEKYSQRVKELGEFNFVVCLFENYSNSSWGMIMMMHFVFVWQNFSYQDWQNILYFFAQNSIVLYELIRFYGGFLGINIGQMIQEDKEVPDEARSYLKRYFSKGTPKQMYSLDPFERYGIEPATLWKRWKEEGAPMNVDV
ncbi:MAG TPA: hypothetical protein DEG17_20705 [Cyanobacteria bacterium UBA11149]|nr:hypothetical protein [Cyanobacteria bacterium UBA11367]HBE57731.1 hypothetical protein [Cyanobacteria bacterium UBA11366]HBK66031.1 hypothetical protein [Cyanobacteria bacterium UBA11166]HBR75797.1 hypothetical protein [Cyanobacteria bacterium UBA11159]HBS69702.1 hypothetical protein [Cyanobacteria bacterium UBA11153]HBW91214.1 hypothetical protein [Cyanobacteria bacterium UBA11149]HCA94364.1 hypothetical protein [Cyanobacteria bacterium UBA9226]